MSINVISGSKVYSHSQSLRQPARKEPLGEGDVSGTVVTCPYHDWRFDLTNGECLSKKDRHVACYAVREDDEFIWVGKRRREASGARGGEHDDGLDTPVFSADT